MPTFDILIDIAIRYRINRVCLKRHAQAILQFVFLDLHQGNTMEHSAKNTKLEKFLPGLICFDSRENQCAILGVVFYQKLSKVINLRDLETDLIQV
jgi:hypothetical protein